MDVERQLYHFYECPYCEKTRRTLALLDLSYESRLIEPGDRSEVLEISGQRRVPVLVDGDTVVPDSTRIYEYLNTQYEHIPPLIPEDPSERGLAYVLNQYAEDVWGDVGYRAQKQIDPNGSPLAGEGQNDLQDEIAEHAQVMENYFHSRKYAVGDDISMADISLSAFLNTLMEHSDYRIDDRYENLRGWLKRVDKRLEQMPATTVG